MKLNLGSGCAPIEGYTNVDAKFGDSAFPLAYPDNSVDEIYASHILEHFPQAQCTDVLIDWVRVLKPGGVLKVAVPDFKWIAQEYLKGASEYPLMGYVIGGQTDDHDYHKALFDETALRHRLRVAGLTDIQPWRSEVNDCAALPVSLNLMGRKPEVVRVANGLPRCKHGAIIGRAEELAFAGGMAKCQCCRGSFGTFQSGAQFCSRCFTEYGKQSQETIPTIESPTNGLQYVAGAWRDESKLAKDRVAVRAGVVMSTPRYGPLDAAEGIFQIAAALQAPRFKANGCWRSQSRTRAIELGMDWRNDGKSEWEEGLAGAIEDALADESSLDVFISVDYDTYATPDDAKELIKLLYQNPQYDCVVSTQIRRGTYEEILAHFAEQPDFSQALVPIITGHFGLTAFRRHVFERLRRPWFLPLPDAEGRWGDGRTDADTYFWQRFGDQGFKAALATQVVVGHGDEGVCWPKIEDGKIVKVWQPLTGWLGTRKPPF